MISSSNTIRRPYAQLVDHIDSYYHLTLEAGLKPNQAAQMVAQARHKVSLPLLVEIQAGPNYAYLGRLAQAAAAAGANIILLTASSFASAKAAVSNLEAALALPLFVRCPIATAKEKQQLQALGAAKVLPTSAGS